MRQIYTLTGNLIDIFFISFLLLITFFIIITKQYNNKKKCSPYYVLFFSIMILLFSVYGFYDQDYYNYKSCINNFISRGSKTYLEPVYFSIANFTGSYFKWRILIWGLATILMIKTVLRFKLSYIYTYLFIIIFYAFSFYKLRNCLGISLLFYGLSYILIPNKQFPKISYFFGITIVICSYWFHKSMPIMIIILLGSSILPFNKKIITATIISFPFFIIATSIAINIFLTTAFHLNDAQLQATISTGASYASNGEELSFSPIGLFRVIITYAPLYIGLYLLTRDTVYKGFTLPNHIYFLYKFCFIMVYFSSLFFFQEVAFWMYIRFLTMCYFPLALVLGYYYTTNRMTLLMKILLLLGTFSIIFNIFYPLYKRFL